MLPTTPRCNKTQKEANKIAALSMMMHTNPISSIPEGISHLEYQGLLMGFHFTFICKVHLCCQFRVLSAIPALCDPGQMHSQIPCPYNLRKTLLGLRLGCVTLNSGSLSGLKKSMHKMKVKGFVGDFFFCLFYVLTILTTLPFASLNGNGSSSNNNCHKRELVAL